MSLRTKVWVLVGLILISFLGIMTVGLLTLRLASDSDNRLRVHQLFKSTYNTVIQMETYVAEGLMTEDDAKKLATRVLRENKYADSEYVYVADDELNFVATPLDPQLHGTSFHDFKDVNGASVGKILENAVRRNPNGIAEYPWVAGTGEAKLSIAQRTPDWGWYIGTGIGFDEVNKRFWDTARWQIAICIILTLTLGGILLVATQRLLKVLGGEPNEVLELVRSVASGNLLTDPTERMDVDEHSIYGSTIRMKSSLSDIMKSLSDAVTQLRAEIQGADNRSAEIDEKFEVQKQETDMVATAMTEMSSTSQTVSESAANAASETVRADDEGTKARNIVESAVGSIEGLAIQIDEASDVITALGSDVENIVSVLDVIRGIAEQTNLLALNAAIEAARAGEQGRGFAVVADEVRNLAKRTQDSTEEIQQMIQRLQMGSSKGVEAMNASKQSSAGTVEQTQHAAQALNRIAQSLNTITDMNNQIATAAEEQHQVGEDISRRVNMIAESSHEAADVARTGRDAAHELVELTHDLEEIMSHFKVD